ncbi:MAG: lytic transglycosylase domain-containing protein [Chitinophagaceae bacterium]|jgi:membrane-bound lytic murein transglycosylase D|nr:lytic transglycosylase domain-containing protein [Chitinophagaceae bacterium]
MNRNLTITGWLFAITLTASSATALEDRLQDSMPDAGRLLALTSATERVTETVPDLSAGVRSTPVSRPYPTTNDQHPQVAGYIRQFQSIHQARLEKKREEWMPHFRLIDRVLTEYGIPLELKYLCIIESDLRSSAVSRKGATGPWQFMPETARSMGLQVGGRSDERYDLYKSTHAAARMLNRMYAEFGDWLLVIAAYNAGPGKVQSAIKRGHTRDFWKLQYMLPSETRNHVKKFMAVRHVMDDVLSPEEVRAGYMAEAKQQIDSAGLAGTITLRISGKFHSLIIAKNLSMDIGLFNALNPDFDQKVGSEGYLLRLPATQMEQFNALRMQILAESVHFLLTSHPFDKNRIPRTIELPVSQALKTEENIQVRS